MVVFRQYSWQLLAENMLGQFYLSSTLGYSAVGYLGQTGIILYRAA
jgi:hypothetical protein